MPCPARMAKKALRGDDLGTPVAKKGFRSDGGKGRFARGSAKAQVADGLFSVEAIIHLAIVTAGALFGHTGGADFFLYQPYRAYPKDLRYSLGLIHPRERFRRCSQ